MKIFQCSSCSQPLNFENAVCESCERRLGYDPLVQDMVALEPEDGGWRTAVPPLRHYRLCANAAHDACNWVVPAASFDTFCVACRHNHIIPDLSVPWNMTRWRQIEAAKRRLFYSLLRMNLPLDTRPGNPNGLAFDFLVDPAETYLLGPPVLTGHNNGLVTLSISEADDVERERRRATLGEYYRTLLGHFRHEIGHYFWNVLVRNDRSLDSCRALFGDDRQDYGYALQTYYAKGPGQNWRKHYVSAYATAHPWEDFAETWAHYLHIVDTLETASAFGLRLRPKLRDQHLAAAIDFDPHRMAEFDRLIGAWLPLTYAVNSLNRSMGQPDLYPFQLSPPAIAKLAFVHDRIYAASDLRPLPATTEEATLRAVIAGLRNPVATPNPL